jgi:hypothetical protein
MSGMPAWTAWAIALLAAALFALFFLHTGSLLLDLARRLIATIQNWPETRRRTAEAEAAAGGRYPLWLRAVRFILVLAMVALGALLIWRKFMSP